MYVCGGGSFSKAIFSSVFHEIHDLTDYRLSLNCRESAFPTLGDKPLNEIKSVTCQVLIAQAGNPCTLEARELPVKASLGNTEHPWPTQATCYV